MQKFISYGECEVRKLDRSELDTFNRYLLLCYPEKTPSEVSMPLDVWNRCYDDVTEYFCLFLYGEPVARCAIERTRLLQRKGMKSLNVLSLPNAKTPMRKNKVKI